MWKAAGSDNYTRIVSKFGLDKNTWPESIMCINGAYTYRFFLAAVQPGPEAQYISGQGAATRISLTTRNFVAGWGGCTGSLDALIGAGLTSL